MYMYACAGKYTEYQELQVAVSKRDNLALETHIDRHLHAMASLTSRFHYVPVLCVCMCMYMYITALWCYKHTVDTTCYSLGGVLCMHVPSGTQCGGM